MPTGHDFLIRKLSFVLDDTSCAHTFSYETGRPRERPTLSLPISVRCSVCRSVPYRQRGTLPGFMVQESTCDVVITERDCTPPTSKKKRT